MSIILSADALSRSVADRALFEDLTFGVHTGDRVGLIGVNGSGKSTLLRVIAGREAADSGRVIVAQQTRISFLPQRPAYDPAQTVLDHLFDADTPRMRLLRDYESTTARLEQRPDDEGLLARLHELNMEMARLHAWEAESEARTILGKLGIHDFESRLGELSGGQRKRVSLARALIDRADLLILDEPTNHLDAETVEWLEAYLARTPGALLLVTHDRYFLDRVTTRIWELHGRQLHQYEGNYETYLIAKAERERLRDATMLKQENLLRKEMAWLQRGARARSTKQKAHIQRVEALQEVVERAAGPQQMLTIALGARRLGKQAIELRDLSKAWDGEPVIEGLTLIVEPGERLGIVGPNGAGKSTFLDLVAGRTSPDSGELILGQTVHLAYYDQESRGLPDERRVIDYIQEGAHLIRLADGSTLSASGALEWFLFPPEQQYSAIGKLSGGEKRRLYLLRTLMSWPNVLLLDEPTNDLDIQTLTVLEDFLDTFAGSVIAVSHDRYFLDRVVDTILAFDAASGSVRSYPGNYSLYRERREAEREGRDGRDGRGATAHAPEGVQASRGEARALASTENATETAAERTRLTWAEKRELKGIEARMALLEARLPALEKEMVAAATEYVVLAELQRERERIEAELEQVMERWLDLSEREG